MTCTEATTLDQLRQLNGGMHPERRFYSYDAGECWDCSHELDAHDGGDRVGAGWPSGDGYCVGCASGCQGYQLRTVPNLRCAVCSHYRDEHSDEPYEPTVNDICCADVGDETCPCTGYEPVFWRQPIIAPLPRRAS